MKEDLAAANVNRAYSLAATSIAIFTFTLIFLFPMYKNGSISPILFQTVLAVMGVSIFSLVFSSFLYYRCSLGDRMSDTERLHCGRRADSLWLIGYSIMFLSPGLILILIGLLPIACVWLALWLTFMIFVLRHFPKVQTLRASR